VCRTLRILLTTLAVGVASPLSGCQEERRVVTVRGALAGIEGAEGQIISDTGTRTPTRGRAYAEIATDQRRKAAEEGEVIDPRRIRITSEDGEVTLILSSPRHVAAHLRQTLLQDEPELLFEQVLSDAAKQAYTQRGLDPQQAVEFLFEHRVEVLKMLQRMPQGELSPGMYLERIGPSAYRLELHGAMAHDLTFSRLDIVWEHGVCKLLSVG